MFQSPNRSKDKLHRSPLPAETQLRVLAFADLALGRSNAASVAQRRGVSIISQ